MVPNRYTCTHVVVDFIGRRNGMQSAWQTLCNGTTEGSRSNLPCQPSYLTCLRNFCPTPHSLPSLLFACPHRRFTLSAPSASSRYASISPDRLHLGSRQILFLCVRWQTLFPLSALLPA